MPKDSTTKFASQVPTSVRRILGEPPLVRGESKTIYWGMAAGFARFISPDDFVAWMMVKDLADYRLEIHRLRRYKALLVTEAWLRNVRKGVASWEEQIITGPANLRAKAEQVKKQIEGSGKSADEVKKLVKKVDAQLEIDCREAEQSAREHVALWIRSEITEEAVAVEFRAWLPDQEALEPLLERAEKKFSDKLVDLERHLRGFANLIWEAATIEGVVVEATALAPGAETKQLEGQVEAELLHPDEPASNPVDAAMPKSAVSRAVRKWWGRAA